MSKTSKKYQNQFPINTNVICKKSEITVEDVDSCYLFQHDENLYPNLPILQEILVDIPDEKILEGLENMWK